MLRRGQDLIDDDKFGQRGDVALRIMPGGLSLAEVVEDPVLSIQAEAECRFAYLPGTGQQQSSVIPFSGLKPPLPSDCQITCHSFSSRTGNNTLTI